MKRSARAACCGLQHFADRLTGKYPFAELDIDLAEPREHRMICAAMPYDQDDPVIAKPPGIIDLAVEGRDDDRAGGSGEIQTLAGRGIAFRFAKTAFDLA